MKKFLIIIAFSFLCSEISFSKIVNVENKITLDFPKDHRYIKINEDDNLPFFEDTMIFIEELEILEPEMFIEGPKNLIDLLEDIKIGKDPTKNKYISSFIKKAEKKSQTVTSGRSYGKWVSSEIKKTLKKAKIDFHSYILISNIKVSDIDSSDLGFDINDYQKMTKAELKQATKEIRKNITEEAGDNKTIALGGIKIVIKRFKITKNENNNLFMIAEAKFYMAINEDVSMDGNYVLFATIKNDFAYAIMSECLVNCSGHGKKVDKMIKPIFSTTENKTTTSIDNENINKTTEAGIEKEKDTETSIATQIRELNKLYKKGLLTEEEFRKAKKKIINN